MDRTKNKKFSLYQRLFKHYPYPNYVEKYRIEIGLTQKELADEIEVLGKVELNNPKYVLSWQTINAIETYRYSPSYELRMFLAEILQKDVEVLFNKNAELEL